MKTPAVPSNEAERLATLHSLKILDTEAEERFDAITRIAKRLFNVEIALVSLVDTNRQWFKSKQGLDASETPRDISFCGHAILSENTFVIEDASKDARFADNPLVTGAPNIRFYAGAPIAYLDGQNMGTLCIIDSKPRAFTKDDEKLLNDLKSLVERELAAIELATKDELTGIFNRRGFKLLAEHSLSRAERESQMQSVVFFDLDEFKSLNDTFGHAEGDKALAFFAKALEESCRESDLVARLSGDEFVAVLYNTSEKQANQMLARLDTFLSGYQASGGKTALHYTAGVVELTEAHHTLESVLSDADLAMYKQKRMKKRHQNVG